jgi:hypothetical protein
MIQGGWKDGNDEGCRAEHMSSYRDIIHYSRTYSCYTNAHAKSIGRACNGFDRVLKGVEGGCVALGR